MTTAQIAWMTKPLSECGEWVSGGTPSKTVASYWNGDIPWISSKSLKSFDLSDSEDRITEEAVRNGARLLPKGAVVFVVRGMSLANEFRVGVTTREVAFNQDLRAIIPRSDMDGRFLAQFLKAREQVIMGLTDNASHGTKRLPTELLEAIQVPVPPLPEQRRIAAILDKADAIRRRREEGIRLTEELLRSTFLDMFGDPEVNPKGWDRVSLSSLLEIPANYGSMLKPHNEPDGWLDLRVANIQDGKLDFTSEKYIHLPSDMIDRHEVRDGDLLMARAIGSLEHLGKCVVVRPGGMRWAFDSHLMRLRFDQRRVHPEFVRQFLTSPGGRHEFLKHARRSAVQFNINTKELARIMMPLPPLEAQAEFLGFAERVEVMNARRRNALSEAQSGFSSFVQRAFRGEL